MMNAKEQLMQAVMLRFADFMDGVCQMAFAIRHLEASARELVEDATEFLASQQEECVTEEDVRQLLRGIAVRNAPPEHDCAPLEMLLNLLFQQAMTQTSREEHAAHCRGPSLDPGGGPLPPDDRDLDDPW
jgi:hypothetical protein